VRMERRTKLVPPAKSRGGRRGGGQLFVVVEMKRCGEDRICRLCSMYFRVTERQESSSGEVGTCQLVELERKGYREEKQLICDRDEEGDGEVVIIKHMNPGHDRDGKRFAPRVLLFKDLHAISMAGRYGDVSKSWRYMLWKSHYG
jgi:hypothetical protein